VDSAHTSDDAEFSQLHRPGRFCLRCSLWCRAKFHLTNTQVGYLTSAFLLFYMVAAPFVGPLADRYSRKLIIVLGAVFWSGLTLLTAVTPHLRRTIASSHSGGVGEATFVTIAPTFVADLFPRASAGAFLECFISQSRSVPPQVICWEATRPHHGLAFPVLYRGLSRILTRASSLVSSRTHRAAS